MDNCFHNCFHNWLDNWLSNWLNNWFTLFDLPAVETVSPQEQLPQHSSHGGMDWSVIYFFVKTWQTGGFFSGISNRTFKTRSWTRHSVIILFSFRLIRALAKLTSRFNWRTCPLFSLNDFAILTTDFNYCCDKTLPEERKKWRNCRLTIYVMYP